MINDVSTRKAGVLDSALYHIRVKRANKWFRLYDYRDGQDDP